MSEKNKESVKFYGKVATLPKNTLASKGLEFLENIRVKKDKLWYLMVEKYNDTEGNVLQLVKYNQHKGVELDKFVNALKNKYTQIYKDKNIETYFENLVIEGNDKFAIISNIPDIELHGKKLVTCITEDLVKLLK